MFPKLKPKNEIRKYSVCFLFSKDGRKVLLQTKDRTAFRGKLNGVGGKLEPDETMIHCAAREILEETGISVPEKKLVEIATIILDEDCADDNPAATCELHFFACAVDEKTLNPPENATEKVAFYDVSSIRALSASDPALAGEGDVSYVINRAQRVLSGKGQFAYAYGPDLPRLVDVKTGYEGKHLSIALAEYEMPDHRVKTYEIATRHPGKDIRGGLERPDGVSILLFDKSGEYVLLEREFRMATGEYVYNLPMGLVDPGESPETAIARELFEETGVRDMSLSPLKPCLPVAYSAPGMSNQSDQLFVGFANVDKRRPTPSPEPGRPHPNEIIQILWLNKKEVAELLYARRHVAFASRAQALLHGWLCGADYVGAND